MVELAAFDTAVMRRLADEQEAKGYPETARMLRATADGEDVRVFSVLPVGEDLGCLECDGTGEIVREDVRGVPLTRRVSVCRACGGAK